MKRLSCVTVLSLALLAGGCSSYKVRCDGKLRPINSVPAQAQQPPAAGNTNKGKPAVPPAAAAGKGRTP